MNRPVSKILVVGATGPAGMAITAQALAAGLSVRALARRPEQLPEGFPKGAEVVRGDVTNTASLASAMQGVGAVVSSLGMPLTFKEVRLLSEGTTHMLAAMQQAGVQRFLCITGMGAGDSRGHGGFVYDRIVLPLLLGKIYADKDRQEALIRASSLDWLIVRPAFLANTPGTGTCREITQFGNETMGKISRQDVAHFMVIDLRVSEAIEWC